MSVRKRTWATKSGPRECYVCQYSISERDENGKRKRVIKTFPTREKAKAFEAQTRIDIGRGVHVPASKSITVEAAGRAWLDSCGDLERATRASYEAHLRIHILPYLGNVKLSELDVGTVRAWRDRLRAEGRSIAMARKVRTSFSSLLTDAQERGAVAQNVVKSMARGKGERRARARLRAGVDIPTPAEIDALLSVAAGRWRPFLLVAIRCGLRASELRGLRWEDVDFTNGVLHVRQRADVYCKIGWPKSEDSHRTVPIPSKTLAALLAWKEKCPAGPLGLVFPTRKGTAESHPNIITRGLIPAWERAGVTGRYTGLHALRHYFASWCLARPPVGMGLNMKEVSERMGHATIALTADVYSHLLPRDDEAAAMAAAEGEFG